MSASGTSLRVCLLQLAVQDDLTQTLNHLEELASKAVNQYQPHILALPECFNFNYCTNADVVEAAAESLSDGATCRTLSKLSKKFGVFILGGSIIERTDGKLYNTSTVWNTNGEMIATYRKVHLCENYLDNGLDIVEVDKLTAGNNITTFNVNGFKCGIAICYDSCFDEYIKLYRRAGCDLVFFPAAYPVCIGTRAWELIHRARANDSQFFMAAISSARDEKVKYVVYGHSMIIDPTGQILAEAGTSEEIAFHELNLDVTKKIRRELPLLTALRTDVLAKYNTPNL